MIIIFELWNVTDVIWESNMSQRNERISRFCRQVATFNLKWRWMSKKCYEVHMLES